jgi:NAD(P)-dependent dehydrogenase (short-subunit alcohol dehydrogenase family)
MTFRSVMVCLSFALFLALEPAEAAVSSDPPESGTTRAVLVTGASSGIGREIAETLAANGFFVYASARKPADLAALNRIENVQAIRLDVTIQSEIDAAVKTIRDADRGLYALVNNAGVLITGPATEVGVDQVEWLFEVNVFGVYRVTQAFAPLLVESRGRIVNIGSVAGSIGIRFLGPYSMSKHAIEAYTDALAAELQPLGIRVSIIAPGDYASEIWKDDLARARLARVVAEGSPYFADYQAWMDFVGGMELKPPDEVAAVALQALSAESPARRYLVVPNAEEMAWVTASLIERLAEMNANHAYSYTEHELTDQLRRAMAKQGGASEPGPPR